jgi:hypothetical protein
LSFFKREWTLDDYPVRLRLSKRPSLPFGPGVKPTPWVAQVEGWWLLSGGGENAEEALADLERAFEKYRAEHSELPRPGTKVPLKWASSDRVARLQPLAEEFVQRLFGSDASRTFISNESTLHDFTFGHSPDKLVARIREEFGVDVSDVPHLNVAAILKRIGEKREQGSRAGTGPDPTV